MYTKLQSNIKFANWIQDQYTNPDQLPRLGQWPTSPASLCGVNARIRRV